MTIDSCLIIKNEMPYIMDLIDQLCEFSDNVIIVDTGSTDGFLDKENIDKLPKNVEVKYFEWIYDFSAARNYSFSFAKSDFVFWCDADDVIDQNMLDFLKELKKQDAGSLYDVYNFIYDYKDDGTLLLYRNNLVKRSTGPIWYEPIHEYLNVPQEKSVYIEGCKIMHKHVKANSGRNRNLDIFERTLAKKEKLTSRGLYYYSQELCNHEQYMLAYFIATECVYFKDNNLMDKYNALNEMFAISHIINHNFHITFPEAAKYMEDTLGPLRGDNYYHLGVWYDEHDDKRYAEFYYKLALDVGECIPGLSFLFKKNNVTVNPALQLAVLYYNAQEYRKFEQYNNLALSFDKNNKSAIANKKLYGKEKENP